MRTHVLLVAVDVPRPAWWRYPTHCANGHEWAPGKVLVGWVRCDCPSARAASPDRRACGHLTVACREPGCTSAWYSPPHEPGLGCSARRIDPWQTGAHPPRSDSAASRAAPHAGRRRRGPDERRCSRRANVRALKEVGRRAACRRRHLTPCVQSPAKVSEPVCGRELVRHGGHLPAEQTRSLGERDAIRHGVYIPDVHIVDR